MKKDEMTKNILLSLIPAIISLNFFCSGCQKDNSKKQAPGSVTIYPEETSIHEAIASIQNTETELHLAKGEWIVSSNLIVPSNISLIFNTGSFMTLGEEVQFVVNGTLSADPEKIFYYADETSSVSVADNGAILSPEWWGAYSDGTHPNETRKAIEAAINSLTNGGTVFLKNGTYNASLGYINILTDDIKVEGSSETIIQTGCGPDEQEKYYSGFFVVNRHGFSLKNITIINIAEEHDVCLGGYLKNTDHIHLDHIKFNGNQRHGYGLWFSGCSDIIIQNSEFIDGGNMLYFYKQDDFEFSTSLTSAAEAGSSRFYVADNSPLTDSFDVLVRLDDGVNHASKITQVGEDGMIDIFYPIPEGLNAQIGAEVSAFKPCRDVLIENCYFENTEPFTGCSVAVYIQFADNVIVRSCDFRNCVSDGTLDPFATMGNAVYSSDGWNDTLVVENNTFINNIPSPVKYNTFVVAGNSYNCTVTDNYMYSIDGVTYTPGLFEVEYLENFTFTRNTVDVNGLIYLNPGGFSKNGRIRKWSIYNNAFTNCSLISFTHNIDFSFFNNTLNGSFYDPTRGDAALGLALASDPISTPEKSYFTSVDISNNRIEGFGYNGIAIFGTDLSNNLSINNISITDNTLIDGNSTDNPSTNGISLTHCKNGIISGNTIKNAATGHMRNGIFMQYAGDFEISENLISGMEENQCLILDSEDIIQQ